MSATKSRRDFLKLMGVAGSASILAACGATPTPTPLPKPTTPPVAAATAVPTKPPAPALEKSMTLYSINGPEIVEPVLAPFMKQNADLKVDIVYMPSTGEGLNRLKAEKANPLADVLWGGSMVDYVADTSPFAAVTLDNDANVALQDKNHIWHNDVLLFQAIGVSTSRMANKANWPKTFKELSDPKWKAAGGIAFASPRASGTGYSLMTTIVTLYDWPFFIEFLKNCKVTDGSTAMFNMVKNGEVPVGFINEDLGLAWKKEGAAIELIFPEDGVSNQVGACGMVNGAKHPVAAKLLLEYILSKEAQTLLSSVNRRPAHKEVTPPGGLPPAGQLKIVQYDMKFVSEQKEDNLKKFDDARQKAGV